MFALYMVIFYFSSPYIVVRKFIDTQFVNNVCFLCISFKNGHYRRNQQSLFVKNAPLKSGSS